MALQYTVNLTPARFSECIYNLLNRAVLAGWTVVAWSDGTTVHNTPPGPGNNGFTTPGSGANGLDNASAWFVMQQPSGGASPWSGVRQFAIQRQTTANDTNWKIKYSFGGGYTTPASAGTNVQMPVINAGINDEQILIGGGTDASPTFGLLFQGTEGSQRYSCAVDDGTDSPDPSFGFFSFAFPSGGGDPTHGFMFDPLISGTFPLADVDPFILYADGNQTRVWKAETSSSSSLAGEVFDVNGGCPRTWYRKGLSSPAQSFQVVSGMAICSLLAGNNFQRIWPIGAGSNVLTASDDLSQVIYARRAALGGNTGLKGISNFAKWIGSIRSTGDTFTLNTTRDRIVVGHVALPWNGAVPTV